MNYRNCDSSSNMMSILAVELSAIYVVNQVVVGVKEISYLPVFRYEVRPPGVVQILIITGLTH